MPGSGPANRHKTCERNQREHRHDCKNDGVGSAFGNDGKRQRLYVSCANAQKVQVIDTATWTITAEVETGNEPDGMAYAAAATPTSATAPRP